jgi:[ribosomal protein S5]-alanine N-acetyltransferase
MDTHFIKGDGINLRELRRADLEGNWYKWFNDSVVTKYQNKKIFPNTRESQEKYYSYLLNSNSDVVMAIVDAASNKHLGNVGLHKIDWVHRSAELGIVIGEKEFYGKKYGKQAWKLITEYGFDILNLHRIFALIMEKNIASIKCAEAAGFNCEGKIRDYFYKNGTYEKVLYYNIIK